jgi:DNA-binding response OmpR family regulator
VRHLAFKADHSGENGGDDPTVVVRDTQSSRQANLLFVDPDRFLVEMIESGLALSRPKWGVVATSYPSEALDVLARHAEFEAIVTEIVFDRTPEAGKLFIRDVGRRWPEIPIFVMTHLDPEETRGLETAEYIAKPPDMDFLVSRIARAIRRQRESLVRGFSLATFAQILEMEQKTCTVIVSHGGRVGELYFRDGRLIQARLEGTEGEDALFGMLSMREHSLRVVDRCDANRRISASLVSLLMEWSAREDHARRSDSPLRQEEG